jgi:hypothetical protein
MPELIDITGQRFGRLVVLSYAGNGHWNCRCDCGSVVAPLGFHIRHGLSKSCGCLQRELVSRRFRRLGYDHPEERGIYGSMLSRCFNPKRNVYHLYMGRGITVCERWRGEHGFANFLADVGPRPSPEHSLDRFPNNDGNYEPGNVRWATPIEQGRNTRLNRMIVVGGVSHCLSEWSEISGIEASVISDRIKRGWTAEMATTTPPLKGRWVLPRRMHRSGARPMIPDDQVRLVREKYATGEYSNRDLAKMFGISISAVIQYTSGKSRRNAGGPLPPNG